MTPNSYELSKELDYLFDSYLFCNKPQMKRLLTYLVQHYSDDGEAAFDQRAIASECLGRSEDFDPAENPVVRIEVGRLRRLLNRFYEEELARGISITIPLGQYRPSIEEQLIASERGYLPELAATSSKPECLSVLLQFNTQGEESSELYLLRHQVRIGLTIDLGKIHGVRLVVALPDEEGQVGDSIDFVMRVVVSAQTEGFHVTSKILQGDTEQELFNQEQTLPSNYDAHLIQQLLHQWVSDYFDPQIGCLWPMWVKLRTASTDELSPPVNAMLLYHQYQINETKENLEKVMPAMQDAVDRFPGDQLVSFALADLYYRDLIHGFEVSPDSLKKGTCHIREALRFDPGNASLHTLLACLTFFSRENDIARMELDAIKDTEASGYSFLFQRSVLQCLMGDWELGIQSITSITDQFGRSPAIYPVLIYIHAWLVGDMAVADKWRDKVREDCCESTVFQCIQFMEFSEFRKGSALERHDLAIQIRLHLEH